MAGIDQSAIEYRQMLINLDKTIRQEELSRMKTFCKDYIGAKNRDQIDSGVALWEKMEERKLLSPKDLGFLKKMLVGCTDGRQDLLDIVKDFETHSQNIINGSVGHPGVGQAQCSEEVRNAVKFLVNNLGRDWKFFMRSLGVSEAVLDMCVDSHPRDVREQIHMAFKEWQDQGSAEKKDLLRALKEIHRNDLHLKLSSQA